MEDLISIIVPVYNTAAYLKKCVDSLTAQTYKNIEIILIDDGSTDESSGLCDIYQGEDGRIKVIHKQNQGAAKARYDALQSAQGKYCTFIDSDDFADSDYVETLYNAVCEFSADMSTCGAREVFTDNEIPTREIFTFDGGNICLSPEGTFDFIFYEKKVSTALCAKMFLTEKIKKIKPMSIRLGEDSYVCIKYILSSKRIAHTGRAKMSYLQRESSAVHTLKGDKRYDYVTLYDSFSDDFSKKCPKAFGAYANKLVEDNFVTYLNYSGLEKEYPERMAHMENNIKKYRTGIIKNNRSEIRTRAACLLSYFGMPAVGAVYKIFDKLKNK